MVWGTICTNGRTDLITVYETLTSARYCNEVIVSVVVAFLQRRNDMLFQRDNACPHTARHAMTRYSADQSFIDQAGTYTGITEMVFHRPSALACIKRMLQAPAADRNKDFIREVLLKYLPESFGGNVLEVASGTGQHITHFARRFKNANFQPTEVDRSSFESISAYTRHFQLQNVKPPVYVDITVPPNTWEGADFSEGSCDVIYNANMIHIAPWQTAVGIFKAAGSLLKPNGYMFMYGPFASDGILTPESNVNFDASLRSRDPSWGIRDIRDLKKLAEENKLALVEMVDMPANNKTLVWQKTS